MAQYFFIHSKIKYIDKYLICGIVLICFLQTGTTLAQGTCDTETPFFTVNLTGKADSVWYSTSIKRKGLCCDLDPEANPPLRCVEFLLTLDDNAQGIKFDISSGAIPPGALGFQINCGPPNPFGELICLDGPGPHRLTFCKPGNNPNVYSITSIPKPSISPPITISDGCNGDLAVYGLDPTTIQWKSVPSNPLWESYLTCPTCDTLNAVYQAGAPDSVVYEATGAILGGCENSLFSGQTTVYFVNDKQVEILPRDPTICFGGTNTNLTATATGGKPPYQYVWNTGETTPSISVGVGTYTVEVFDNTACPTSKDTVTVTAFNSPIVVHAGSDQTVCTDNPNVQLNGSVQQASGGVWSGGNGSFTSDSATLNALYSPSASEIVAGFVQLQLTSTGNGSCPGHTDQMRITITPAPTINAGADQLVCSNNPEVLLNATKTVATGGVWNGAGTFTPSANQLSTIYTPTLTELQSDSFYVFITSTGNGTCNPVSDSVKINVFPAPIVDAGNDITICSISPQVTLSGSISNAGGGTWSGGSGIFSPSRNILNPLYTPSQTEIQLGSVKLYLKSTTNGLCIPEIDSVLISFVLPPTVDAGPDLFICADNPLVSINALTTHSSAVSWANSGGVFNPNQVSESITYVASAQEINDSLVTLFVTASGNPLCPDANDDITIRFTSPPVIDAGPDISECINTDTVILSGTALNAGGVIWTSSGTGTFITSALNEATTYLVSDDDKTNGSIQFTLTSTNNGSCNAYSDDLLVQFLPNPTVNAGNDTIICTSSAFISLRAGAPGKWLGNGGVFENNDSTRQTVYYTFSQNEMNNLSTSLIFMSEVNGVCPETRDTLLITLLEGPKVNAGDNITVCAGNDVLLNGQASSFQTFSWRSTGNGSLTNTNTLNPTYVPSTLESTNLNNVVQVNFTLTATHNICPDVSDLVAVTFLPKPRVEAGPNQHLCATSPSISVSGIMANAPSALWSSNVNGFFNSPESLTTVYNTVLSDTMVTPYKIYLTTIQSGVCPPVKDSLFITFEFEPSVNLGNDTVLCLSNNALFLTAETENSTAVAWSCTNCSGSFSSNQLTATYIFSANDKVNSDVVIRATTNSASSCPQSSDELMVRFTDVPEIIASTDSVCSNSGGLIELSTITNNTDRVIWTTLGSGTFEPDNEGNDVQYRPSVTDISSGKVQLVIEAISCLSVFDTISFNVIPAPIVSAGPNQSICASDNVQLSGSVQNATGGIWISSLGGIFSPSNSDLNAVFTPSAIQIQNGKAQLILQSTGNGECLPVNDTLDVTILPSPVSNLGSNKAICETQTQIPLEATVTNATSMRWSSSSNGVFSPNNNSLEVNYKVSSFDRFQKQVIIYLEAFTSASCKSRQYDSIIVTIYPEAKINFQNELIVCEKDVGVAINAGLQSSFEGRWSTLNGSGVFSSPNTLSTNYFFSESDKQLNQLLYLFTSTNTPVCEENADTLVVNLTSEPVITFGPDQYYCDSIPEIKFDVNVINANTFNWSTSGSGSLTSPANSLQNGYQATASDTALGYVYFSLYTTQNGGCDAGDGFVLRFIDKPIVDLPDENACIGDVFNLTLNVLNYNYRLYPHEFSWYKENDFLGSVTGVNTYGVTEEGAYSGVFKLGSCKAKDDNYVVFNVKPVPDNIDLVKFCSEATPYLTLDAGPAERYYWSETGETTRTILIGEGGIYNFQIINEFDCPYNDSITVINNCPPRLFAPTIFTPNGDNDNDFFFVTGAHVGNFDLKVISRWGEVVYRTNDRYAQWDGNYHGEPLPVGVYNWIISYTGIGDYSEEQFLKGMVTIAR